MTASNEIPLYVMQAVDQALEHLKRCVAEMRAAQQRAERGPGYDGSPPVPDADSQGRMRRAPAIELMWKKGMLSDGQYLAAQRYWIDRETATIAPMQVARYDAPVTDLAQSRGAAKREAEVLALSATTPKGAKRVASCAVPLSDLKLDAIGRINRVHERILKGQDREWNGASEADRRMCLAVVEEVAVRDFAILHVAATRKFGNRNKVAKRLKVCLDVMARHYGTASGAGPSHIRGAHDDDYRPSIDGAAQKQREVA